MSTTGSDSSRMTAIGGSPSRSEATRTLPSDTGSTDSTAALRQGTSHGNAATSGSAAAKGSARSASTTRTGTSTTARSGTHQTARKGPRRVRLAVARVDPWSVMKMSFLLSVAAGIAGVILTAVLWMILSTMNVFSDIEGVLQSLQTTTSDPFSIKDYVGFGRVVSLSIVVGVIDVILMTAIATVMAFLYNICSALVGGVQLTLTDD